MKIVRVAVLLAVLVGVYLAAPVGVSATCYTDPPAGPVFSGSFNDTCVVNAAAGSAEGTTYYNCGTYCNGSYDDDTETCAGSWQYGCYYHTFWCDSPSCGGTSGGSGTTCANHNDCGPGQCCKGGTCSSSCTPPPPDCNPGEVIVWREPPEENTICRDSMGACTNPDGIVGGVVGRPFCDKFGDENCCTNARPYGCSLGDCVVPCVTATPTQPALTSPANLYNSPSMTVQMRWGAVVWGNTCSGITQEYRLYGGTSPSSLSLWQTVAYNGTLTYTRNFTNPDGRRIYWRVDAVKVNSSTGVVVAQAQSAVRSFYLPVPIQGRVYEKRDDVCADVSATVYTGAGTTVSNWGNVAVVDTNAAFNFPLVPLGTNVFSLSLPAGSPYSCACAGGCNKSVNVTGVGQSVAMFIESAQDAWWQTVGGDVGAQGGTMTSTIPGTCIGPGCLPYVTRQLPAMIDSAGVLWIGGVASSFGAAGSDFSENTDYRAYGTSYRTSTKREGYDYFYRLYEMGIDPVEDGVLSGSEGNMPKPSGIPANQRAFFVRAGDGSGTVTIDQAWSVGSGESVVVFVDGNLEVGSLADLIVAEGGFLALIVKGNITFVADSAQGVFVADGGIEIADSTEQFAGEGMFIGWSGVYLGRDFEDFRNNSQAANLFTFRPDLLLNTPDRMKRPVIRWEEVAP